MVGFDLRIMSRPDAGPTWSVWPSWHESGPCGSARFGRVFAPIRTQSFTSHKLLDVENFVHFRRLPGEHLLGAFVVDFLFPGGNCHDGDRVADEIGQGACL